MVKITKKDYPWTIIIEDKISANTGKKYQSIGIGLTEVADREAIDPKDKYKTKWLNLFDEQDLLTLSATAENAYQRLKYAREREREVEKLNKPAGNTPSFSGATRESPVLDDDLPFKL